MKQGQLFSLFFLITFFFSSGFINITFAQTTTSSNSATMPSLITLPTLWPTASPMPSPMPSWPIVPQFDAVDSTSTTSAVTATSSATVTPTQDYCLDVPIIMYHHIEPLDIATQLGHPQLTEDTPIFEDHIRYLVQQNYHMISLGDLVHALLNHGQVPSKSVVLTFDDGYIDNYSYAFLMAKKYQVIMNFMIPTGLIGQPDYMTWDHLKEMAVSPYARIYNHTTNHAPLGLIDQSEIVKEVTTANQDLEKNLGIKNDIIIYPYGSYSDLAIQTLQQLGMTAALSTDPGRNDCVSNIMKLPRVRVGNAPLNEYGF